MSSAKILVLTSSHLCRNPRVVKEATTLGNAGYDVTVMSTVTHAGFAEIDRELARGLPFRRDLIDYSAKSGAALPRFFQRARTWAARKLCRTLGIESAAALGPANALLARAHAHPADLIIAHTEIPLCLASRLIRGGKRVAVDLEDWYSEDLPESDRRGRPLGLLRSAERFALHHAAYVSTPSDSIASALVETHGGTKPIVVRNVFPLPGRVRVPPPSPYVPAFVWFSQTIGPKRGLDEFLAAWSRTQNASRVCLIGGEHPGYREQLLGALDPARRRDVEIVPLLTPAALTERLTGYDIGLALEPEEPRNRGLTTSNKLFQYLGAGLAVVATNTAGQIEGMRAATGAGFVVPLQDTAHFASQLDELLGDPARLRACQLAARAAAERELCWEREEKRVLEAVSRALAKPQN